MILLIKKCAFTILTHLSYLINYSQEGIFPSMLKIDNIIPVYKKDDPKCLDNYHPISTLPIFFKLYGLLIIEMLLSYFNKFSLITNMVSFPIALSTLPCTILSIRYFVTLIQIAPVWLCLLNYHVLLIMLITLYYFKN